MSLVNIDSVHRQVLQILSRTEPPAGIELMSYKRNRSVSVSVISEQEVIVRERGYEELDFTIHRNDLPKILKTMIKREFPRSRKVRINKLSDPAELGRPRKTL